LDCTLARDVNWEAPLYQALNGTKSVLRVVLPPVDISIYNRFLWGVLGKEKADMMMPLLHEFVGKGIWYSQLCMDKYGVLRVPEYSEYRTLATNAGICASFTHESSS
jgi:hypothetical protein